MSYFIVRHSPHKDDFTLMTTFADGSYDLTDVSIPELIQKNRYAIDRVLTRIKNKAADMEHRKTFQS